MAQDITAKRQNVASRAVAAATQIVDALNVLLELKDERAQFNGDFQDSDFAGTALKQLTAAMVGTLFDFVVPSLQTNYLDAGNGGRNKQILLQVRG
jgi:hypothetical protein